MYIYIYIHIYIYIYIYIYRERERERDRERDVYITGKTLTPKRPPECRHINSYEVEVEVHPLPNQLNSFRTIHPSTHPSIYLYIYIYVYDKCVYILGLCSGPSSYISCCNVFSFLQSWQHIEGAFVEEYLAQLASGGCHLTGLLYFY